MRKRLGIYGLILGVSFLSIGKVEAVQPVKSGPKFMTQSDVMPEAQCRMNRLACICSPGLYHHTFVGANGERYVECLASAQQCAPGQILKQTRTPGGKSSFQCEGTAVQPYAEPKVPHALPKKGAQ